MIARRSLLLAESTMLLLLLLLLEAWRQLAGEMSISRSSAIACSGWGFSGTRQVSEKLMYVKGMRIRDPRRRIMRERDAHPPPNHKVRALLALGPYRSKGASVSVY
jgi:hypothetical protein